ncbi:MAG: radical SAM protein [Holophagales bacterium]|jgi:molybdenum cofactor biosynthesis enzyme MoaA|nr:radical SAM protein [Holophagales bacterium]
MAEKVDSNKFIFYGAGQYAQKKLRSWLARNIVPLCFSDADESLHYKKISPPRPAQTEFDILPLKEALELCPDGDIYITIDTEFCPKTYNDIRDYIISQGIAPARVGPVPNEPTPRKCIFYGAGIYAQNNLEQWVFDGIVPVCFADSNTQKHYTKKHILPARDGEFEVLPVHEALDRYPDAFLYITTEPESYDIVYDSLVAQGVPPKRIGAPPQHCRLIGHSIVIDGRTTTRTCCTWKTVELFRAVGKIKEDVKNYYTCCERLRSDLNKGKITCCTGCPELQPGTSNEELKINHVDLIAGIPGITKCNFKCFYCNSEMSFSREAHERSEGLDNILEILQYFATNEEVRHLDFSAGEITISPHRVEIFKFLEGKDWKVTVFTNVSCYVEELKDALSKNNFCLITSLDSGTSETFAKIKGVDAFQRVVDNLEKYAASGGEITVKYIVFDGINCGAPDLDGFIAVAERIKANVAISWDSRFLCRAYSDNEYRAVSYLAKQCISRNIPFHVGASTVEDMLRLEKDGFYPVGSDNSTNEGIQKGIMYDVLRKYRSDNDENSFYYYIKKEKLKKMVKKINTSRFIFYGAGQYAQKNLNSWLIRGLVPLCFSDADESLHYKSISPLRPAQTEFDILPLQEALELCPDADIYITIDIDADPKTYDDIRNYIISYGVASERVSPVPNVPTGNKCIFYGAGVHAYHHLEWWLFNGIVPICFADSNPQKHHTVMRISTVAVDGEFDILPVHEALERYPDAFLYITTEPESYDTTYDNLVAKGVPPWRIGAPPHHCQHIGQQIDLRGCTAFSIPCGYSPHLYWPAIGKIKEDVRDYYKHCEALRNDLNKGKLTDCTGCPELRPGSSNEELKLKFVSLSSGMPGGTKCNFKCFNCNHGLNYEKKAHGRNKDIDDILLILHYFAENEELRRLEFAAGEITISPHRAEILKLLKTNKWKGVLFTNASCYVEELMELLSERNYSLLVSMDAGTPETFAKIKGVDAFHKVVENLDKYASSGGQIYLKYIVFDGLNCEKTDLDGFVAIAEKINTPISISWDSRNNYINYCSELQYEAISYLARRCISRNIPFDLFYHAHTYIDRLKREGLYPVDSGIPSINRPTK